MVTTAGPSLCPAHRLWSLSCESWRPSRQCSWWTCSRPSCPTLSLSAEVRKEKEGKEGREGEGRGGRRGEEGRGGGVEEEGRGAEGMGGEEKVWNMGREEIQSSWGGGGGEREREVEDSKSCSLSLSPSVQETMMPFWC